MANHQIHFILRPDAAGTWYVQEDATHEACGVDKTLGVVHYPDHIRVYFSPVYPKAGTVQISTDDDFAGALQANANLGTQSVSIYLRAWPNLRGMDPPIDPKRIWKYLRSVDGYGPGAGNLWVNITMCD